MNGEEHLKWAKERAIAYAKRKDLKGAYGSFIGDMGKHPETKNHGALELFGMMFLSGNLDSEEKMTKFINDFA